MWTRQELKTNAKQILRRTYWTGFLICLAVTFLSGVSGGSSYFSFSERFFNVTFSTITILTVEIIALLYGIFIAAPLNVGVNDCFIAMREYDISFGRVFRIFSEGQYLNVVKVTFFKSLYIFLWTLLLIVPGIIKSYEYFFIPYLLADNPGMDKQRAFELSREMTRGEKFNIFVLQLSFIGWELLGLLACGVGTYFVIPYTSATFTELYIAKRTEVIMSGFATEQDFSSFRCM